MTIYLACTVRGDRGAIAAARAVADVLEQYGHSILTRHLLNDDVEGAEAGLTERAVFERDMRWLTEADLLIAEASGSSYGVGFEVGYVLGRAAESSQRVLLLYDVARRGAVSRLITGISHPRCTVSPYSDTQDLLRRVHAYMAAMPV
jgi:hypothetical protein